MRWWSGVKPFDAPQHSLGAAADVDLAVDRADVGLHGVGAQVGQAGDLGVALALGDERQDLRFPVAEAFAPAGPVQPAALRARGGASLTTVRRRGPPPARRPGRGRQASWTGSRALPAAGRCGSGRGESSRCRPRLGARADWRPGRRSRRGRTPVGRTSRTGRCRRCPRPASLVSSSATTTRSRYGSSMLATPISTTS